jgi:hypothetical protein
MRGMAFFHLTYLCASLISATSKTEVKREEFCDCTGWYFYVYIILIPPDRMSLQYFISLSELLFDGIASSDAYQCFITSAFPV